MTEPLEQTREQILLEIQLADDFRDIMNTIGGRRYFWNLIADCQCYQPIFHENHAIMSIREGKRQIGLRLLHQINTICPELYQVMVNENTTKRSEEN